MNPKASTSWVCPNDRELMLRAKLETGWSCKSSQFQSLHWKQEKITDQEKKAILEVLSRAQKTEEYEKKRISKMIERLKNMKKSARGNGQYSCILCNESFGLFGFQAHQCHGCNKLVCNKCGVDTFNKKNETIWFCKICSETREGLKYSNCLHMAPQGNLPAKMLAKESFCKAAVLNDFCEAHCETSQSCPPVNCLHFFVSYFVIDLFLTMAARRISKSTIDWTKFASAVPKSEIKNFNAFKARSDAYLTRVLSYPENPPQLNFEEYRNKVASKEVVQQLEQAYKALKIAYPKDTLSGEVDEQEAAYKKQAEDYVEVANTKVAEAEKLRAKFEVMIPVRHMTSEDFVLTFPDWCPTLQSPSIFPHYEKTPGLSKEERARLAAPDGAPFSI